MPAPRTLNTHIHGLSQLLWQYHNSCLWMENGVVCHRLSWVKSDILRCPIWNSASLWFSPAAMSTIFPDIVLIYCTVLLYVCIIQVIFRLSKASSHCVFKLQLCLFLQKKWALAQKSQLNVSDSTGVTEVKFCSINPSLSFWFFSPKLLWCDRFRQQSSSQPVITLYVCLFFFLAIQWGTQTSPDSTHHSLFI